MLSLKKLVRDMWLTRSRALSMVVAIATGLIAFNTLVGAHSILTREIARNYMDSKPASILLEMDDVGEETLAWVEQRSDIEAATRRVQVKGRFSTKANPEKRRAFFFIVDDFQQMPVAKIFPESGAFPPKPGTVLMERSAVPVVGAGVGATLFVDFPGLPTKELKVSGLSHEPALAPANTEQAAYLYLSQAELSRLGLSVPFSELRITPKGPQDIPSLERKARQLSREIEAKGLGEVTALRVPPPGKHPHQMQMTTVLTMFVLFAGLIVVLSSLLTASLLSTMMARQVREMGIMKTLGASSWQILLSYTLLVQTIALLAWVLAFFPAEMGVRFFVQAITGLLNFDVVDESQSLSARLIQTGVALLVPLLVSLPALFRGSGVPVIKSLADYGVSGESFGKSRLERWALRWESREGFFTYALRTALRRRGRFVLSLALLATAGAIFLAAVNTARSWSVLTQDLYTSRHYDLEVGFSQPVDGQELAKKLASKHEILRVESWLTARTTLTAGRQMPIERTYPDGAHGAFSLVAVPSGSNMVSFNVSEGRLLDQNASGEVVLNQVVPDAERVNVGDQISLSIEGTDRKLRVVGKVEEVGTGAVAYVSQRTFLELVPTAHRETSLRVQKAAAATLSAAVAATDRVLQSALAPVTHISPLAVFENAVAAHFEILVRSLLALAALTALVGTMGLTSALSANVHESTRELAVLRALGANSRQIRGLVTRESLLVTGVSFVLAAALGLGLSALVGNVIGMMSFSMPLPFSPEGSAFVGLFLALIFLGALASLTPAGRAARLTVSQALRSL